MKLALKMGGDYRPDYYTDRGDFKVRFFNSLQLHNKNICNFLE